MATDRATKKAYFTDLDGNNVVDFQFTPEALNFSEGGRFADRISTGQYFTDYIWISGKPSKFSLNIWVDRTSESMSSGETNVDPFEELVRRPKRLFPRLGDIKDDLIQGIKNSAGNSGFLSAILKKPFATEGNSIDPSVYSATPDFSQSMYSETKGVYYDLEKLLYFVRPLGLSLGTAVTQTNGSLKISDYTQARFTPPPMVRFFYGNTWAEGYFEEVDYSLTVMNKLLVPRRLEADITFLRTKWGYLDEVGLGVEAVDYNKVGNNTPS